MRIIGGERKWDRGTREGGRRRRGRGNKGTNAKCILPKNIDIHTHAASHQPAFKPTVLLVHLCLHLLRRAVSMQLAFLRTCKSVRMKLTHIATHLLCVWKSLNWLNIAMACLWVLGSQCHCLLEHGTCHCKVITAMGYNKLHTSFQFERHLVIFFSFSNRWSQRLLICRLEP